MVQKLSPSAHEPAAIGRPSAAIAFAGTRVSIHVLACLHNGHSFSNGQPRIGCPLPDSGSLGHKICLPGIISR